jgi:hypothetical protein
MTSIESRLMDIEAKIDRLLNRRSLPASVSQDAHRITVRTAAARLNIGISSLRKKISRGYFTIIAPEGRGVGKDIFLYPDEVELMVTGDELALRAFRRKKGRLK